MTRPASVESKSGQLVFRPKTVEDFKISEDVKRLAIQDEITVYDLLKEAIQLLFKVHHWPPGNPQLTLQLFNGQSKLPVKHVKCCFNGCKKEAVASGVFVESGAVKHFCAFHFDVVKKQDVHGRVYRDLKLYKKETVIC